MSPPHVFISYDHSDVRAAEQVARVLARVGLRPWLDRWEIAPGERWETTLTRALESAAAILALVGAGPSRQVETEVHAVVAQTPGHPALVPVLLPGAHGLPDLLVDHAVLDLRDTPVDSVAGAAALLRAVLGVLPDHRTEYPGSDRTLWPNELREDLKRVRRILGDDHPDVVRIEAMLAAPAAASTSGDTADPPTTAELLRRGQVGDRDRSQPNDGSNPQDRKPSSATEGRLIQGDEHLSPGESSAGADLLARLGRGQVCQGVVSSVADFGAFVDLGGVEGVVHVSELAWKHIDHPSEVVQVGQEVTVTVLDVELDRERVSLSLKATQEDPWRHYARTHAVGQIVPSKVTKLAPFGAFVRVEEGIEGLVHISELATWHVEIPEQVVQVGDDCMVQITHIDLARRRISLSLKQANEGITADTEFDPTRYGMAAEYDEQGNHIYPEGFEVGSGEWQEGFEDQREAWEREYGEARTRYERHIAQAVRARDRSTELNPSSIVQQWPDHATEISRRPGD